MKSQTQLDFESWAAVEFYGGLENISHDWCEKKNTYKTYAHHMAWNAWQHLYPYREFYVEHLREITNCTIDDTFKQHID